MLAPAGLACILFVQEAVGGVAPRACAFEASRSDAHYGERAIANGEGFADGRGVEREAPLPVAITDHGGAGERRGHIVVGSQQAARGEQSILVAGTDKLELPCPTCLSSLALFTLNSLGTDSYRVCRQ